jgi:hypothetical protein
MSASSEQHMTDKSEPSALEQHLSPVEIAEKWGVSPDYVRRRFRRESGVVKLGSSWRIPVSIVERVYRQSLACGPMQRPKFRARRTQAGFVELIPKASNAVQ